MDRRVTSPTWGPHLHVNRPLYKLGGSQFFLMFDKLGLTLVFTIFLCSFLCQFFGSLQIIYFYTVIIGFLVGSDYAITSCT